MEQKNSLKETPKENKVVAASVPTVPVQISQGIFDFLNFKTKCIVLAVIAFGFYVNTLWNEYAFDDSIAITQNTNVQAGFGGITDILTSDAWASLYSEWHAGKQQYEGGRYRPLSQVIFAIEHQLFGEAPWLRHLVNILSYVCCVLSIFYFLNNYLLAKNPFGNDCAFLSTLLFTIHPLHTEVVANLKSLDEILSLLFLMGTFIFSHEYLKTRKVKFLVIGIASFFFAFLAKEYAIMMVVLLPVYFILVVKKSIKRSIVVSLFFYIAVLAYLALRINAVGIPHDIVIKNALTNPLDHSTSIQRFATKWYAMGRYIIMLFYPYPLACDYTFNQIPYKNMNDISVWIPIFIYTAIIIWGIVLIFKNKILAFLVFFFLFFLVLISNFFIGLGAPLGERLVFHSSLAFVTIISYSVLKTIKAFPLQFKRILITGMISILVVICGIETIIRNGQWKSDETLFPADVIHVPNSSLVCNDASYAYLSLSEKPTNTPAEARRLLDSSKKYALRALSLNHTYLAAFLNLGGVYFHQGLLDSAKHYWDTIYYIYPAHPSIEKKRVLLSQYYFSQGIEDGKEGKVMEAISSLRKAASEQPQNAEIWYNLGGAYFTGEQYDSAKSAWTKALKIKPGYAEAQRGLNALH